MGARVDEADPELAHLRLVLSVFCNERLYSCASSIEYHLYDC
jgi:hypothetical protein